MRYFALNRVDGGVEIMQMLRDDADPVDEISKWSASRRAEITGDFHEISEADYRAMPGQGPRDSWKVSNGRLAIDAAKKTEIEARPAPKTLEQRLAALEDLMSRRPPGG